MLSELWNCNRLWKIWYATLIVFLQGYLIFNAIRQYITFKSHFYNPRFGGDWNLGPLHLYIGCIIASISLMGFFIYFSLINVNWTTTYKIRTVPSRQEKHSSAGGIGKLVMKLTQIRLPYSHLLHLVIAVVLLLPLPVVQMEQIKNEALSPDSVWISNFDFFSEHFDWFKADSLPNAAIIRNIHYVAKTPLLSVEFLNFLVASFLILIKMPTVFWSSHRGFSVLYSVLVFANCATWLVTFEAASIVIRGSENEHLVGISRDLFNHMHYPLLLTLIILHFLVTLASFLAIFVYGNSQTLLNSFGLSIDSYPKKGNCCITFVVSLGFSLLVVTLIFNAIIYSTFYRCYQTLKTSIFMVAIIVGTVNLTLNFLTWFTFAIKTKWVFSQEHCNGSKENENNPNEGYRLSGVQDPIYGCFHNNITLSSSSSHSSGPGTVRTAEGMSPDFAGHGNNFQNYIYMQANTLQIPTISEDYDENQQNFKTSSRQRDKISVSTFDDSNSREVVSTSDNGINQSIENINSDSYRSLQCYGGKKFGKLVKFQGMKDDSAQVLGFYEGRYSSNNFDDKQLNFLKVPDILNVNQSNLASSHSESSLDRVSSSASSKVVAEHADQGLCSDV